MKLGSKTLQRAAEEEEAAELSPLPDFLPQEESV